MSPSDPPVAAPTPQGQFRKKLIVIDALHYIGRGNVEPRGAVPDWFWEALQKGTARFLNGGDPLLLRTLEGDLTVSPGDWIIRGIHGELYPCKPDIFDATYERVAAPTPETPSLALTRDDAEWLKDYCLDCIKAAEHEFGTGSAEEEANFFRASRLFDRLLAGAVSHPQPDPIGGSHADALGKAQHGSRLIEEALTAQQGATDALLSDRAPADEDAAERFKRAYELGYKAAQEDAAQVSHPQPEGKTPLCPQCQRPMTWTATAPVVGARMEWRCFHHADLGTVDGCEVIEVDADGHVSRPVKGPLREGPVAHPVVSPRTKPEVSK